LRPELADVLEVLRALAVAYGMSWEDVEAEAAASGTSAAASTSGSFSNTSTRPAEYRAMRKLNPERREPRPVR